VRSAVLLREIAEPQIQPLRQPRLSLKAVMPVTAARSRKEDRKHLANRDGRSL
jgi:hypothetical protein